MTRSRTGKMAVLIYGRVGEKSYALLDSIFPASKGIRLLGISMSSFGDAEMSHNHQMLLSFEG
jgi:DNA polymerase-4